MTEERKPRILSVDVETAPNAVWTWGLWGQNVAINQIEEPGYVLCFAAKWYGEDDVVFKSLHADGKEDMLNTLWDLVNEADAVMGWNSQSFDMRHINREFLEAGYLPPTEVKHIDLLKVVRKQFKFLSNKLDFIAQQLDIGKKVEHSGFKLWRDVMNGDPVACKIMREYNEQDVLLVEEAYELLKPWITVPTLNLALFSENPACPRCGGEHLTLEEQPRRTTTAEYDQYRCNDCGYVARAGKKRARKGEPVLR